jgi:hypothetical protein
MWDLWWTKRHWDRFPPSTSVFPRQFHSVGAPLLGKGQKIIIIIVIFITGLHNKPQCCGASVASAAGPFTTKKISATTENPLRPVAILVDSAESSIQPFLCVFKKSKFLQASRTSLNIQLLFQLSQFCLLLSDELDL